LAVISDTHIGSLYHRAAALAAFYAEAEKQKVSAVLCAGDILAGWKVYRGQEFELRDRGLEEQLQRLALEWPDRGLRTLFITGNHDASIKNLAGVSVGNAIRNVRKDLEFIGEDQATIELKTQSGDPVRVMLIHPGGGTSYALSYKVQKLVESLSGGQKPHLLCVGHYHKAEFIPSYRNVSIIQAGTFESQTPFMARQGLAAHVGGWIVEIHPGTKRSLCGRIRAEFIPFYEPGE
jgi:UDP-2,3-diacylglucosamine pyrophosphatase LpxH